MWRREFRSLGFLEDWVASMIGRYLHAHRNRAYVSRIVDTIWRDGYRCGDADRRAAIAQRLGLDELRDPEVVDPWRRDRRASDENGLLLG